MRKHLRSLLLFLFVFTLAWLLYSGYDKYMLKKEAEDRINMLPNVSFLNIEGKLINLHNFDKTNPLIIIYFHAECEHCQYEAQEIGHNANMFDTCQLLMISANDSIKQLKDFCAKYNLWEVENIEVLIDKENRFSETFGRVVIPSVYIYDKNQKLKKRYLGETKLEAIISQIQNSELKIQKQKTMVKIFFYLGVWLASVINFISEDKVEDDNCNIEIAQFFMVCETLKD